MRKITQNVPLEPVVQSGDATVGFPASTEHHAATGPKRSIGCENADKVTRLAYSVREVAAMLNVSSKSVRRLLARDLLKASKALRHLRITRASLESFLAE